MAKFKKGHPGGPGRPSLEKTFSETARKLLAAQEIDITYTLNGKKKKIHLKASKDMHYGIAAAMINESLGGNVKAMQALIDRIEGKPIAHIEGDLSASINFVIAKDDADA